jgi:hypothetical protein
MCALTEAIVPRYFLQDFEVVTHPITGQYWFAPGPAAFENVVPKHRRRDEAASSSSTDSNIQEANESASPPTATSAEKLLTIERRNENPATTEARPRRAPVTVYSLSRKPILDIVGRERDEVYRKEWLGIQRLRGVLIRRRKGSAVPPEMQRGVQFRKDMSGLLLKMMRRTTVDGLLARAVLTRDHQPEFIVPVTGWDEVKGVQNRGCVLWLPREDGSSSAAASSAARPYTTMDVDGVGYDRKMAVHNLHWLLGETEVARLRKEAPNVFGTHDILVLRTWTSWSIKSLHLMLWRLQGYLAELDTK